MEGLGYINWWGFSPAVDLQMCLNNDEQALEGDDRSQNACGEDEINFLLIGAGDCRHIFQTVARSYRHPPKKLNFYVIESSAELYARHMLLMKLVLESQQRYGLQDKTEMFLELHGNSLVRQQCMDYVQQMSTEFIKMVTDLDYMQQQFPLFDLSLLKFKERDVLEGVFKFWRGTEASQFDIAKCWDLRLRQYLGVRYDAIPNVFDWDFHMKLVEREAAIINGRNYNRWRHKGIAYELREGTYDIANRTLASGMVFKHEGERLARRGYWGDIVVSPYIAFGISSEEKSFFKKSNNILTKTSEDVAQFNVMSMMHEVQHRNEYHLETDVGLDQEDATTSAAAAEVDAASADGVAVSETSTNDTAADVEIVTDHVKIYLLPLNSTADLVKKAKFHKMFNVVYISNSHSHVLTADLAQAAFASKCCVLMETARYLLELTTEQTSEFVKKIASLAESAGCKVVSGADVADNTLVKCVYQ